MLSKNTLLTIVTKFGILLANFALVVFSTRIWGSEGRGEIALVLANVSIIVIFSNFFCGSTVAFHASRVQRETILGISFAGALMVTLAGAFLFSLFFGRAYFIPLFLISFLMSLTTVVSSWWLGRNNIARYNTLTFLNPLFILIALAVLYYLFNKTALSVYFSAYYIGLLVVSLAGFTGLMIHEKVQVPAIRSRNVRSIFTYGLNNEFSYLIQFLNYRLSYYFIARMLGLSKLGLFSIVVSISEAVWIISRSMSAVHFSNVINSDDQLKNRKETIAFARQSFLISIILLVAAIIVPDKVYQMIFGDEFSGIRRFILYMTPGITAIAVSNLYGHYFAGTGKLKIVRNKSLLGLASSLILLPVLIKKYQLTGACISLNISYLVSAFYLWLVFRRESKKNMPDLKKIKL